VSGCETGPAGAPEPEWARPDRGDGDWKTGRGQKPGAGMRNAGYWPEWKASGSSRNVSGAGLGGPQEDDWQCAEPDWAPVKPRKTEGKIRTPTVTVDPGSGLKLGGKRIKNRYIQGEGWLV